MIKFRVSLENTESTSWDFNLIVPCCDSAARNWPGEVDLMQRIYHDNINQVGTRKSTRRNKEGIQSIWSIHWKEIKKIKKK